MYNCYHFDFMQGQAVDDGVGVFGQHQFTRARFDGNMSERAEYSNCLLALNQNTPSAKFPLTKFSKAVIGTINISWQIIIKASVDKSTLPIGGMRLCRGRTNRQVAVVSSGAMAERGLIHDKIACAMSAAMSK